MQHLLATILAGLALAAASDISTTPGLCKKPRCTGYCADGLYAAIMIVNTQPVRLLRGLHPRPVRRPPPTTRLAVYPSRSRSWLHDDDEDDDDSRGQLHGT
ncbi:hypothetical protein MBM_05139 [Drepanopeziza brunnea f. sp. 'multigermtubi' MB_m1]|uniref:Uncharacterized protein n=1 Tax=Marssonina brunnea f. sp. multigermtubi (strain MB_m1) TaxID=1072389 RepID=K1WGL6_MARBU|nr:uncharacterized protein MBM_05139 [Drepanopeziza brunnea f. sp. 'multigermtubi' MB_m1]EKD16670.1 hypothetical protein MBM_05139 [Drepanopeziza brunnea f. sp. 'multigermtubi' MB_m1]